MRKKYIVILIIGLLSACRNKNKNLHSQGQSTVVDIVVTDKSPETTFEPTTTEDELFDEMKFMPPIEYNSYLGIEIGKSINNYHTLLKPGVLETGEGSFNVQYIIYQSDTLGYVLGKSAIESIHIWDARGATNDGVRVGTTFKELTTLLKDPEVHGSEIESRVHVLNKTYMYRLNYNSIDYHIDQSRIPDTVRVKEIIVFR